MTLVSPAWLQLWNLRRFIKIVMRGAEKEDKVAA
jgi:hypothetical protein